MPTSRDRSTLNTDGKIFARDLVHDLIPKLKTTQNLVNDTLRVRVAKAGNDDERSHYQLLQQGKRSFGDVVDAPRQADHFTS
jgi:hypothetical protein